MISSSLPVSEHIDVVLVDENDQPIGTAEKLYAHQKGFLHRAFSVFLYNEKGQLLIQRRALGKYHSPGLWANTCCGHPYVDEENRDAAVRRVKEELCIDARLKPKGHVRYALTLTPTLYEREFTYLFEGFLPESTFINPNPQEILETAWCAPEDIRRDARKNPHLYARWFRLYLLKYYDRVFNNPPQALLP
jgi:isopentenyl-diphosphate delta-isomerase